MISKKIIRKIYAPLNITTYIEVQGNPVQIRRMLNESYYPDRSKEPLRLVPRIHVATGSGDNSWTDGLINKNISEVTWYANGQEISTIPAFAGKYSINGDAGDLRGTLTLSANILPEEQYEFVMSAVFTDPRTRENITVRTDTVSVFTTEETVDEWDLSVVHDVNIKYHPLYDSLKEYDWKVANGIIEASDTEKQKCYDGNQYDLFLPIIISKGTGVLDENSAAWEHCNVRLYAVKGGKKGEVTPENCLFVKSISKSGIRLDLRFVPDGTILQAELEINAYDDTFVAGIEQMTITRVVDNYICEPTNEGDINTEQTNRKDKVVCYVSGKKLEYPEAYLSIDWYTNSHNTTAVYHGHGASVEIDHNKASIGTGVNCWLETYVESRVKSYVAAITVDDGGNVLLMDEKGNIVTSDVLEG